LSGVVLLNVQPNLVIAGFIPATHGATAEELDAWVAGTSPAMTRL
jgi:hypothetical protein